MNADVVIALSLPLEPVGKGDLDSIVGVLQRAFAVGIENNEARDRKLANIVIMPDIKGFSGNDYLKTPPARRPRLRRRRSAQGRAAQVRPQRRRLGRLPR